MAQTKITVDYITALTSSAAELNYVDITTLGTAQASKVLTVDANVDVGAGLRNLTGAGFLQGNTLRTTVLEYTDGDDAITIADGGAITVAQNATFTGTVTTPSVLFKGSTNAVTVDVNNGVAAYSVVLPDAAPTAADKILKTSGGSPYSQLVWGDAPAAAITATSDGADTYLARYTNGTSLIGSNKLTFTESSAEFNINLSSANPYFRMTSYSTNNAHEPYLELRKSHHGTIGTNSQVQSTENLGTIAWAGVNHAGNYVLGAKIYVITNAPFDNNPQEDAKMYFAVKNGSSWQNVLTIADNTGTYPSYETEGVVGIGETSPVAKLHVKRGESGVDPYGRIAFFEDSGDECYIHVAGGGSSPTGGLLFGNGNGQVRAGLYMHENQVDIRVQGDLDFRVASSGNITGSHGTYHTSSDSRVKENIVNSDVGLDILMQMRPVKFNFMENVGLGINTRVGFIAQEIESLVPEVVHTADTPHDGISDMKAIEDMQLIPILVKAIQELNAKVDALS